MLSWLADSRIAMQIYTDQGVLYTFNFIRKKKEQNKTKKPTHSNLFHGNLLFAEQVAAFSQ